MKGKYTSIGKIRINVEWTDDHIEVHCPEIGDVYKIPRSEYLFTQLLEKITEKLGLIDFVDPKQTDKDQ